MDTRSPLNLLYLWVEEWALQQRSSVALVRAMAEVHNQHISLKEECDSSYADGEGISWKSSGLDHTVSALGQSIYFHKTPHGIQMDSPLHSEYRFWS